MYAIFANRGLDSVRISMGEPREHGNRMSIGESHGHGRTPCAYGGVNGVTFRFIVHSSASGISSASSLIQFFSIVLNVRHRPRIVVLVRYVSAWENLISVGEPHEHQRIA